MICNVILSFVVLFLNGSIEHREKWMDKETAEFTIQVHHMPSFKEELRLHGIKEIKDHHITHVPPYNCMKGPNRGL